MPTKLEPKTAKVSYSQVVYVEKAYTVNMGNHSFAKVTVGVELPQNPTKAQLIEAKKTIDLAISIVDEKMEAEINKLDI